MATSEQGLQQVGSKAVRRLLAEDAYKKRFEQVLGDRAPQFMASIVNLAQEPNLAQCEPQSIIASAFVAATLDLPIDKNLGFAWLVPYNVSQKIDGQWQKRSLAQFQMGYRGFVQLAFRTCQYTGMNAVVVNEEALGRVNTRTGEVETFNAIGEPLIDWEKIDETKEAVGYAFAWQLTNGFAKVVYWPKDKMQAHAERYSKAYQYDIEKKKEASPWSTDFDKMAIKTIIKNSLNKWGILSVEMQRAFAHDQGAQPFIDGEVIYPDNGENGNGKPEAAGAEKVAPISEEQRLEILSIADKHGAVEKLPEIMAKLGFKGLFEIPVDRFVEACDLVASWNNQAAGVEEETNGGRSDAQHFRIQIDELLLALSDEGCNTGFEVVELAAGTKKLEKIPDNKLKATVDALAGKLKSVRAAAEA